MLPSLRGSAATSRQKFKRFLAQIGKHGERQLGFTDLYERLLTEPIGRC